MVGRSRLASRQNDGNRPSVVTGEPTRTGAERTCHPVCAPIATLPVDRLAATQRSLPSWDVRHCNRRCSAGSGRGARIQPVRRTGGGCGCQQTRSHHTVTHLTVTHRTRSGPRDTMEPRQAGYALPCRRLLATSSASGALPVSSLLCVAAKRRNRNNKSAPPQWKAAMNRRTPRRIVGWNKPCAVPALSCGNAGPAGTARSSFQPTNREKLVARFEILIYNRL